MEKNCFIIHLLLLFQMIYIVSDQDLNIIKVGGPNFANVNLFSDGKNAFMGTSGLPYSEEKIIYDINNCLYSLHNGTQIIHLPQNNSNSSIPSNFTYKNFSGQSILYETGWVTISRSNNLEYYDLYNGIPYSFSLENYFGFSNCNFIEFGNVVEFVAVKKDSEFSYIFPFIIETGNTTSFVIHAIDMNKILEFYGERFQFIKDCGKGKVISCFSNKIPKNYLTCLYRDTYYQLSIIILNEYLEKEIKSSLVSTKNSTENENMFFKGITFQENTSIIAYYTDYQDNYLRISYTKLENDEYTGTVLSNCSNDSSILIDASNYNKHYMLNDLVKLENNDIYFAASSKDKETLYITVLKINGTVFNKKFITIDLFKEYKHKFYNELKLISYQNNTAMGFSHCNSKNCEETNYHTTSLVVLNEFKTDYNFDLIKSLYDSNFNESDPILIDFDIYKNNILGLKFKSITFIEFSYGINLLNPNNNTKVSEGIPYDFSSFKLNISLNSTGVFNVMYSLNMDDTSSSSSSSLSSLRRLLSEEKTITFTIEIDKTISYSCDDKCSICLTTDPNECISCKYDYSFVGDKKYCFDQTGDMNMSQIEDIYDNLKENLEEQNFITIAKENAVFQLSTIEDQLDNSQSVSSIDLGECEERLREQEGISDDEQFIIMKMDLKNNSVSATYVQYEIFNPHTLAKVSLDICEDVTIKIHTPVSLSESKLSLISSLENSGYNAFDINDDFYNDICSTYTAENGADIVLSYRKSLIYDQNKEIYLCQSGCEFDSFNTKNGRAECNCKVQKTETVTDVTKINFDKTKFIDSFYKTLFNSNFRVLKCVKLLLSAKGFNKNFGSYLMTALLGLFIVFIVLHLITGQKNIMNIINTALKNKGLEMDKDNLKELIKENEVKEEKNKDKKEEKHKKEDKKEEKDKKEGKKEEKEEKKQEEGEKEEDKKHERRKSIKKKSNKRRKSKDIKVNEPQGPPKRRKSRQSKEIKIDDPEGLIVNTKANLVNQNGEPKETKETNNIDEKEHKHNHHRRKSKDLGKQQLDLIKGLNDQELNTLDYEYALVIDKRTYFQYYISLLKKKHLILFTFIPQDDYNLTAIKILLFIISFSLYFTINGFFFSDKTMNKLYEDNGVYNFIYQLPQIFYSAVISAVINMILKMLSLSEKKVLEIKKEKTLDKAKIKANNIKKGITITLILFLGLSSVFMLFFWYFISCFCAVYNNTQGILITDTLISFGLSMLYPFGLNLLPGLFRIPALRAPKKDQKYKYKISGYIALV